MGWTTKTLCFGASIQRQDTNIRTVPFWAITQRVVILPYRRFGTSYQSHHQESRIKNLGSLILDPGRWERQAVPKYR